MSVSVNLTKRVDGIFRPVVISANGRIKPDWVVIGGQESRHLGGSYYLDWTIDGKRKRKSVGSNPAEALTQKLRKEAELSAVSHGIELVPQTELDKRRKLDTAVIHYLDEIALNKKSKTLNAYTNSLKFFVESCGKTYLEEVDRLCLLRFSSYLRDTKGQQPRTVRNNFANVITFLKSQDIKGITRKGDWPVFTHSDVETYEREDLDRFLAVCDREERLLFEFLLMTGMREQEAIHTTWRDVNPVHGTVSMRWKSAFSWSPKAYREREIPVPSKLIRALESAKPVGVSSQALLFPTSTGLRNWHMLESCKAVAKRAGLDPEDWFLHKFRATFATMHLQSGVDLATVQNWMGHKDLASTMRYLKSARNEHVRQKVNATFD